jgi:hypothetical protein
MADKVTVKLASLEQALMMRESQVQPVLLVCEDLHWIDSETQAVLNGLVESLPACRILLLVSYRPRIPMPGGTGPPIPRCTSIHWNTTAPTRCSRPCWEATLGWTTSSTC